MRARNFSCLFLLLVLCSVLTQAQITPSQDAYTNSTAATTNYGAAVTLGVESTTTAIQTTYIQFDLSSIPSGYSGANVAKASLKLYVNSVAAAGSFNIDFVSGTWSEKKITANLAPALGSTIVSSVPLTGTNVHDYVIVDVTTALQAWLNGTEPNDGIALVANSGLNASFDSKENTGNSQPAELEVIFSGGTITGVTTASGSGLSGGTTSGTANLSLTTACASNQVLQWNGSAWVCANQNAGGTITGVTPGFGLIGGGTSGNVTLSLDTTKVPLLAASNAFIGNQSINGNLSDTGNLSVTGFITAPFGEFLTSSSNSALYGLNTGSGFGLVGESNSGVGIYGVGANDSIEGYNSNPNGVGVLGYQGSSSGFATGVYGQTFSTSGTGVIGNAVATSGNPTGVFGGTQSPGGYGVLGYSYATSGVTYGVSGETNSLNGYGVAGMNFAEGGTGIFAGGGGGPDSVVGGTGLMAQGGTETGPSAVGGAGAEVLGGNVTDPSSSPGVGLEVGAGECLSCTASQVFGGVGIVTSGSNNNDGDGIMSFGNNFNQSYAGNFAGNVYVSGNVIKSGGSFKIDHPLDPANKYLSHSFVESPDMKNIYDGTVTTDAQGNAAVDLPDWFEALNRDFRYQLTVIGQFAQAIVAGKIQNNRFTIKTDKPNVEVSWQVTGIRQDAWANAHRIPLEEEKNSRERGHFIHPELYGAPEEKSVEWARHPNVMRHMKEMRTKQQVRLGPVGVSRRAPVAPATVSPNAMQLPRSFSAPSIPANGSGQTPESR